MGNTFSAGKVEEMSGGCVAALSGCDVGMLLDALVEVVGSMGVLSRLVPVGGAGEPGCSVPASGTVAELLRLCVLVGSVRNAGELVLIGVVVDAAGSVGDWALACAAAWSGSVRSPPAGASPLTVSAETVVGGGTPLPCCPSEALSCAGSAAAVPPGPTGGLCSGGKLPSARSGAPLCRAAALVLGSAACS
jgi:hypothetical protein